MHGMTARRPLRWLVWLGTALLALTLFGLLLDVPAAEGDGRAFRVTILLGLLVLAASVYFAAVRLILRYAWPRGTMWIVVGVAIALRLLLLTAPPILSSDIYRYVWDGRVQAAGINPYRDVPADPALAFLRDPVVYPQINRAGYARTIYPPLAEVVFAMTGRLSDNVTGIRLVMLGFEAVGIICLLRLLPLAGLPRERILIYAWNPLALWSFANDGHVDAIAVVLLGLALLLRARHKDGWAGAALAGAVLAKFFPLVVAPAFLRGGNFWRPALAGVLVIGCGYALYSGAGLHVLGFLPSYGQEAGLVSGTGLWALTGLARLVALSSSATLILRRRCGRGLPCPCGRDPVATGAGERRASAVSRHRPSGRRHRGRHQPTLPLVLRLPGATSGRGPLARPALARDRTAPAHRGACPR
jgi:hypothetical protein